ncbi:MAG: LPS assembly protein LptD [Alphaproteobacteria bacterium]|nr:LPS assembly protein LptD [Alphaproteobacteria bacterium]
MREYIRFSLLLCFIASSAMAIGVNEKEAKTVTSQKIIYNTKTGDIKTSGKTEVVNASGQKMVADKTSFSKTSDLAKAKNIEIWLGQNVYINAEEVERTSTETIAKSSLFTACDKCDEFGHAWEITSTTINHDSESHMLYFHNPVLWIAEEVPIFYFPYFAMPDPSVKYKSGILMPNMNSTNDMGTQINVPIYINFADNHDLTATLSYLTNENPLFQGEHRLNLSHSEFRTKASYTKNKAGVQRWHLFNNDTIELGEKLRANVFVQRVSDKTYLQKYNFYNDEPYLDSGASLELFGKSGYVFTDAHFFQELRQASRHQAIPSGNILPHIRGTYKTNPFFKETYLTLTGDGMAIDGEGFSNQRLVGEARVVSPWTLWGGNRITASLSTRYDIYNFQDTKLNDGTLYNGIKTRFLPSGYVEWSLPLFNATETWTHIIEPRARLTIMQQTDNKIFALDNDSAGRFLSDAILFSDNRFSGLDVWENGNFADYGLRWAAYNQNNDVEVFIGQTYDFTKDKETLDDSGFHDGASDYVGRISYKYSDLFNIASRMRVGKKKASLKHMENTARIGKGGYYLNIGHIWNSEQIDETYVENKTNEFVGGVGMQFTDRWGVRFNSTYNIEEKTFQRHSGGIFYTHPCFHLSLEYRRDNAIKEDYRGGTTVQFKFGFSIDGTQY